MLVDFVGKTLSFCDLTWVWSGFGDFFLIPEDFEGLWDIPPPNELGYV